MLLSLTLSLHWGHKASRKQGCWLLSLGIFFFFLSFFFFFSYFSPGQDEHQDNDVDDVYRTSAFFVGFFFSFFLSFFLLFCSVCFVLWGFLHTFHLVKMNIKVAMLMMFTEAALSLFWGRRGWFCFGWVFFFCLFFFAYFSPVQDEHQGSDVVDVYRSSAFFGFLSFFFFFFFFFFHTFHLVRMNIKVATLMMFTEAVFSCFFSSSFFFFFAYFSPGQDEHQGRDVDDVYRSSAFFGIFSFFFFFGLFLFFFFACILFTWSG